MVYHSNIRLNIFLESLLNIIGIDIGHLKTEYLSQEELRHIDSTLKSLEDFELDFYSNAFGKRLEVLLQFLHVHKNDIIALMKDHSKKSILINFYTSSVISGNYDCFRFNLSKFPKQYESRNQVLTLYRIGRADESEGNLGCSWSKNIDGLKAFVQSSSISSDVLTRRLIFEVQVDDSEVLFSGNNTEQELVLRQGFKFKMLKLLDTQKIINTINLNLHI